MSLNPLLFSPTLPARVFNEAFLLSRDGIKCKVTCPGLPTSLVASGSIVLSTLRIVFLCDKKVPIDAAQNIYFHAFEFPLTLMSKEKFNQPIFGSNYLSGEVLPIPGLGLPGPAHFELRFIQGGCGTFLHFFLRALREVRTGRSTLGATAIIDGRLQAETSAYIDPNDPTVIYIRQPVVVASPVDVTNYGPGATAVMATAIPVAQISSTSRTDSDHQ